MLAHSRIRVEELEKLVFEPLGNLTGRFRPLRAFRNASDALPAPSQPRTPLGSLESAAGEEGRWRKLEAISVCGLLSKVSEHRPAQAVARLKEVLQLGFSLGP